jgi:hypothetical protein
MLDEFARRFEESLQGAGGETPPDAVSTDAPPEAAPPPGDEALDLTRLAARSASGRVIAVAAVIGLALAVVLLRRRRAR